MGVGYGFCCVKRRVAAIFPSLLGQILILQLLLSDFSESTADIYDEVGQGGARSGNPGVKMRLTQNGLNYFNDILRYEMNTIIPRLHLKDIENSEGRGTLRITDGRVTNYKQPTSQSLTLNPPDTLLWKASGANIAMTGHVQGTFGRFSDSGDVDVYANNVDFVLTIEPTRQSNGQFGLKSRDCDCTVGSLDYAISNSGMMGRTLENMKPAVTKRMKPRIEDRVCAQAKKIIDEAANEQLASFPTKIQLNKAADEVFSNTNDNNNNNNNKNKDKDKSKDKDKGGKSKNSGSADNFAADDSSDGVGDGSLQRDLSRNVTKQMQFDYASIAEPTVGSRWMETYHKGEVSYHGQGGTPFQPPEAHERSPPSNRMASIVATDYVANSMLYNAYAKDLLKSHLSASDTPEIKNYLKTNCGDGGGLFDFCLGSLIPEIQATFPNSQVEVEISAIEKAPAVLFRDDGTVDVLAKTMIRLLAERQGQHRLMAVAVVDATAKAKLFIDDKRIKGNCTIKKYELTMKENYLKQFDKQREKEFTSSSRALLESVMNIHLRKGLKLPTSKVVKLKNPSMQIFDRTLRIDTDLDADREELTKRAVDTIRRKGGHVDGL